MSLAIPIRSLRWLAVLGLCVAVVYAPGLGGPLFFDDELLTSGDLFRLYGVLELRERLLSYGSFVWIQALVGEGWWKQRVINVLLHLMVVAALWGLYRKLLRHVAASDDSNQRVGEQEGAEPALLVAVGFFALNPVAVYGVAYLIQRSILMATLFVVLGLWSVAKSLTARPRAVYALLAALCYALAIASKEYAVFAPLAAVPIYILIARPKPARLAIVGALISAVGALGVAAIVWRYGALIGKPFDEFSQVYVQQLAQIAPDAPGHAWPLSIMNQAYLFFEYGLRWALPWSGWMSINLRPIFPVSFLTFPHLLGPVAYLALLAGGFFLLLRYRDTRALAGLSLLLPALLFPTEFATVWVQDPFVLYRSYLWAIGIPGLVFFALHGFSGRALAVVAVVVGSLLGWQSLDRIHSLSSPERLYTDAVAKLPNDPRAVGRWFPYLNRGNVYFDANQPKLAEQDFRASSALGDGGIGIFNIGNLRLQAGDPQGALAEFAEAEKRGYKLFNLPMQRGAALVALGRLPEAYTQFQAALALGPSSPSKELLHLQLARVCLQIGKPDEAIAHAKAVLEKEKRHREAGYVLAMGLISQGNFVPATRLLDVMIGETPAASLYYARAMAHAGLKRKAQAQADIDEALRLGLDNPVIREWQKKIGALPP
jgi:predicted negative regulator of RcsB-dependent stress response